MAINNGDCYMFKPVFKGLVGFAVAALVAGCTSTTGNKTGDFPDWVMAPGKQAGEGALADTECVRDNASMSMLKSKAIALARANIAQQIQIKVQAMDKTYQAMTESDETSGSGSTFESVSKQVTDQMLRGAIPDRMEYISSPNEGRQLCVMVVLSPEKNKQVFNSLLQSSDRQLTPENEALLYQEYRAQRAQEELEEFLNQG